MIQSGEASLHIRMAACDVRPPDAVSVTLEATMQRVDRDVCLAIPGARFVLRVGPHHIEGRSDQTGVFRTEMALFTTCEHSVAWSGSASHGNLTSSAHGVIELEQAREASAQAGVAARGSMERPADWSRQGATATERRRAPSGPSQLWALCPMVEVGRGRFMMGASDDDLQATAREHPQHEVVLTRSFSMGRGPVTRELWIEVMGFDPSTFGGVEHPVDNVSWEDAVAFCNALSARLGLPPAYEGHGASTRCDLDGPGVRLPTEAEWEYACRAGTGARRYGRLDEVAWYGGNADHATHPVAQKTPNSWGLHDMLGNVWEWCWDWRHPYEPGLVVDPTGPHIGAWRILRGGSWGNDAASARASSRSDWTPGVRGNFLGLRICRTHPGGRR